MHDTNITTRVPQTLTIIFGLDHKTHTHTAGERTPNTQCESSSTADLRPKNLNIAQNQHFATK